MAKQRTTFVCQACGADFPKYYGKCPACDRWNSMIEQLAPSATPNAVATALRSARSPLPAEAETSEGQPRAAVRISQISDRETARWPSGYRELDRVLGGGIVPGSLVLVGGEPGIGKSTLLLQVAGRLARDRRILYVSAEESGQQVKMRAQRLGVEQPEPDKFSDRSKRSDPSATIDAAANFYLLPETDLEAILRELESLKPSLAVIDSIQTIYFSSLSSAPGSVAQVRECTSALMQVAKREGITLFIVGHVTKEGAIAGPRVLEHLVDAVLFFEGDRFASHRLLRSMKNRFGATYEIGVFEMAAGGLQEVSNPSELFLSSREELVSGSAIVVACEGTRPIVVEVQALVSPSSYGSARRSSTGCDNNRLLQILAVLEKRVGIPLSKLDAYVASVGGIVVSEPAADLGLAIAIVASFRDKIADPQTAIVGEVGLGGQVRPVSQLELRLREVAKLGFRRAIVPKKQKVGETGLTVLPVGTVMEAILAAIPGEGD